MTDPDPHSDPAKADPQKVPRHEDIEVSVSFDPDQSLLRAGIVDPPIRPGQIGTLERFELLKRIGVGGMGVVYLARDGASGRSVAVKVLKPDLLDHAVMVRHFLREARLMQALSHPNILPIIEVSDRPGGPYFATPLIESGSLASRIRADGPLDNETATDIARQVAEALDYCHKQGVIHRDIKPANVLLHGEGRAYLCDLGLGQSLTDVSATYVNEDKRVGTAAYMAPEIVRGEAGDPRCDVYSFGAMLYEMLTGQPPYNGQTVHEVLARIQAGPPEPILSVNPKADACLARIAKGAMARELRDRYATMADVVADIERVGQGQPPNGPHKRQLGRLRLKAPSRGKLVTAAVTVAAIVAVVLYVWTPFRGQAGHTLVRETVLPFASCRTGDVDADGRINTVGVRGAVLTILDEHGSVTSQVAMPSTGDLSTLEDFDGDGVLDIGIGTFTGKLSSTTGYVYIYSGQAVLKKTISRQVGHDSWLRPVGVDSAGNMIIVGHAGYSKDYRGLLGYNYVTGSQGWAYGLGGPGWPSFADIDGDGKNEFTIGWVTLHNGYSVNGTDDDQLYLTVFDDDGSNLVSKPYPTHTDGYAEHVFTDLNRDGTYEILGIESHGPTYYHGTNKVHLFDVAGNVLATYEGPYDEGWYSAYSICDIDSDGMDNVVVGNQTVLTILDEQLRELRSIPNSGQVRLTCDLTGDGYIEIVTCTDAGLLRVFDRDLHLIDSISLMHLIDSISFGGPVTVEWMADDYDADGVVELMVPVNGEIVVVSFIPEPAKLSLPALGVLALGGLATLSLLALGGLAMIRRRPGKGVGQ